MLMFVLNKFISHKMSTILFSLIFSLVIVLIPHYALAKTKILKIGKKSVSVEIADTNENRAKGLMRRKSLAENHGMFFVFDRQQILSFWMKNTFIPLSIAFINANCVIVDIQKMNPQSVLLKNTPNYTSKNPAKYALEVNQGWFLKNKIQIGNKINCKNKKVIYN